MPDDDVVAARSECSLNGSPPLPPEEGGRSWSRAEQRGRSWRPGRMASSLRWDRVAPLSMVLIVVAAEMWQLRAQVSPVAYGNDSSVHEQMVRFATDEITHGRHPCRPGFRSLAWGRRSSLTISRWAP